MELGEVALEVSLLPVTLPDWAVRDAGVGLGGSGAGATDVEPR